LKIFFRFVRQPMHPTSTNTRRKTICRRTKSPDGTLNFEQKNIEFRTKNRILSKKISNLEQRIEFWAKKSNSNKESNFEQKKKTGILNKTTKVFQTRYNQEKKIKAENSWKILLRKKCCLVINKKRQNFKYLLCIDVI
jgi:hypothetical protein